MLVALQDFDFCVNVATAVQAILDMATVLANTCNEMAQVRQHVDYMKYDHKHNNVEMVCKMCDALC